MADSTRWPYVDTALAALRDIATGLRPDDLAKPSPCSEWTVGQVLEHAALDQYAWAGAVTLGRVSTDEGDAFAPLGTPADRVLGMVDRAVTAATEVWSGSDVDGATLPTPLPQGPMDSDDAAAACALDAAVHSWDVAIALGRPSPLDDELAAAITPTAHRIVEPLRQWGAYAAVVEGTGGGAADELLRYLGRDPLWTA